MPDTATLTPTGFPPTNGGVHVAVGKLTIAEVNAGTVVIPAVPGRAIRPLFFRVQPIGGAVGGLDAIVIGDTADTPVVVASFAQAQLAENAVLTSDNETGVTQGAGFQVPLTTGKGVKIYKTGSAGTTATHLNYQVWYIVD
jgi:hypothetical protein